VAWVEHHGGGFRIRYRLDDGILVSETGFATKSAARARANDVESDKRRGTLTDPRAGQTLLGEWVETWSEAHDVSAGTWAKYQSHLRNHILPRFGATTLGEINRMAIKAWVKTLRRTLAEPTVADVVTMLSMVLGEAVEEGLIGANPCRKLRINVTGNPERPHAQPWQVLRIAQRCRPTNTLLILTAAYTGMRWGELAGLQWSNVHLRRAELLIHPEEGALHEVGGQLTLGPPKTAASTRTVHLPPFLVSLLTEHRHEHDHQFVFAGADGGLLRRSNFRNRVWLPAVEGHTTRGWAPLFPGLHFHDLRHTHKTWLIEDAVPEVAQFKRLGHRLAGVRGIYSHVSQPMIDHLLAGLQRRWEQTGSIDPVTTTVSEMWSRSFAPNMLPADHNGRSTKIVNRPFDQHI
jgi:integrase